MKNKILKLIRKFLDNYVREYKPGDSVFIISDKKELDQFISTLRKEDRIELENERNRFKKKMVNWLEASSQELPTVIAVWDEPDDQIRNDGWGSHHVVFVALLNLPVFGKSISIMERRSFSD